MGNKWDQHPTIIKFNPVGVEVLALVTCDMVPSPDHASHFALFTKSIIPGFFVLFSPTVAFQIKTKLKLTHLVVW